MNDDTGTVHIEVKVMAVTKPGKPREGAVRCQPRGRKAGWVAKVLIHDDSEVWDEQHLGQTGRIGLPLWKAEELGWE